MEIQQSSERGLASGEQQHGSLAGEREVEVEMLRGRTLLYSCDTCKHCPASPLKTPAPSSTRSQWMWPEICTENLQSRKSHRTRLAFRPKDSVIKIVFYLLT